LSKPRRSILPFWLSAILAVAFVVTGIMVSAFFYLSLTAFLDRPLNPLAQAAEAVSDLELQPLPQEGLVAVPTMAEGLATPTLIATSIPRESDRVNILVMFRRHPRPRTGSHQHRFCIWIGRWKSGRGRQFGHANCRV